MLSGNNTLGQYRIVREIARSNDIVYEALDSKMGRRVAVKELQMPPNLAGPQRQERIERFYREARAAGKLTHPNIVTIYDVSEQAGRHYIAMEYLEGQSLRELLNSRGALHAAEAVRIATAVAEALEYAHRNGVIHRDVKPDNVQVLPDGRVKLTDFGIARITFESTLTVSGQIFGTPSYMSPEQVEGKNLDARSDLFSLGVMLYEMLAGAKPFTGDSVITVTYNIVNREPPPLSSVSPALNQIIRRAMAKDSARRFATAGELVRELQRALQGGTPGAPGSTALASMQPPPPAGRPVPPVPPMSNAPVPAYPPAAAGRGMYGPPVGAPAPGNVRSVPYAVRPPNAPARAPARPRPRPKMSPETRWLMGWVGVAVVIGLLVLGIAVAATRAMQSMADRNAMQRMNVALNAGNEASAQGRYEEAWQAYRKAAAEAPAEYQLRVRRSAALVGFAYGMDRLKAQQFDLASQAFQDASKLDPDYGDPYSGEAERLVKMGQVEEAVTQYDKAFLAWQRQLSDGTRAQQERVTAIQRRDEALRNKAVTLYNEGLRLEREGNRQVAAGYFLRARDVIPRGDIAQKAAEGLQRINVANVSPAPSIPHTPVAPPGANTMPAISPPAPSIPAPSGPFSPDFRPLP